MSARAVAPPLPAGLSWVNVDEPPSLDALRGRVVLLWFWSADAVNAWNVVPNLRRFEHRYHDGLTILGLHCPKYPHLRSDAAVLSAVNRLRLKHAVASDVDFATWRDYGVEAWPTIALIDVEGRVDGIYPGEGRRDEIDARIAALLEEGVRSDQRIYEASPQVARPEPLAPLAFPSGVWVDARHAYVCDSGHHRVLECTHEGRIMRTFGSANAGHLDGSSSQACFDTPTGIAGDGRSLYVADAGNHCVRAIDLASGDVSTVVGSARAGRSRPAGIPARECAMNTPLAVACVGEDLYVAVAGQHQVWMFDRASGLASVLSGSGEAGRVDGDAAHAQFAQPSALATAGRTLYLVDAATSAVRMVDAVAGEVATLVGVDAYAFGDACGALADARLQNPTGVAATRAGMVYVADTYNDCIKLIDRRAGTVTRVPVPHPLGEPQGLALFEDALWIANSARHEIVRLDLASGAARVVPIGVD